MRALLPLLCLACVAVDDDPSDDTDVAAEPIVVVTWNTGTSEGMPHESGPDDGYGAEQAAISDAWYGDGLAWRPAVDDVAAFLSELQPDVIAFQEIFHAPLCADIPAEARTGFVCEDWSQGDPTVAQRVLGAGYQVACHLGKDDKCVGVRRSFGALEGCEADLCMDAGLVGEGVEGCGSGARVARGRVQRDDGEVLTLVAVHGSSGFSAEDQACRVAQVEQAFDDLPSDGPVVILGDFNTDPGRAASFDPSAARLVARVEEGEGLHFLSDVGPDAEPTYVVAEGIGGNIDHVISDGLDGACWSPGIGDGGDPVYEGVYFDHVPVICEAFAR